MSFSRCAEIAGHSAGIYSLAFDGEFIYSGSADKYIARWNPETGRQDKFAIRCEHPVYAIELIQNNSVLIAGLNTGDIHVIDVRKREEIKFIKQHQSAIFCILFNPHTAQWYSADADGNLAVWSAETVDLLAFFPMNCGKIRRMAINKSGNHLAIACQDGNIRILDTATFNEMNSFYAHQDGATAVSFDDQHPKVLWSGGKDAILRVWDLSTNKMKKELPAHNYVIYEILDVKDSPYMITASRDKTMKVWNKEDYSFVQKIDSKTAGHRHSVNALIPLWKQKWASSSDDKRLMIWKENGLH